MAPDSLPAQIARTRRFTLGVPGQFTVTADERTVLFLRTRSGDDPAGCLWALDLASGAERLLADPAELASRSRRSPPGAAERDQPETAAGTSPEAGIGSYATDHAGDLVAFSLASVLWTADLASGLVRSLPALGPVTDPRPDPAGQRIAYLSDGALRVIGADGGDDREIAAPDGTDVVFGVAPHTEATSPGGPRGYWWAPDGSGLLAARTDSAEVPTWYLPDPSEPARPPRTMRYTAAGMVNPQVTLWIVGLDGSRARADWDLRALEYLVGGGWDSRGPYAVVQSRDQRTVRFLAIDPASGTTTVLAEQRDECWVQLIPGLPARTGSGVLVAHADAGGTRYLTVSGAAVTPPGLQLREVLGISGDDVLFTASRDPARIDLWAYRPGEGITRFSDEPGVHSGVLTGGTLIHVARTPGRPGGQTLVRRRGEPVAEIGSLAEWPVLDVRVTRLTLGPRELRAHLFLPSWHGSGGGSLPVLLDPYGGAAAQRVTDDLDSRSLVSQWFAEQGFAVLVADGAGTPGRGPAWEREVHGDPFGPVLDDQVAALREAALLHPDLDLSRVGIRGWSFGGSLAALAVLRRPDVFHAAVAGAGVTDQFFYEAHWRERFLGHPADYPERYEACSLIRDAPNLTRPLLLIHGLADDNVHPANTLRLSGALLAAGRPHEVLLLPGTGHSAIGGPVTESLLRHQTDFLRRHLSARPDGTCLSGPFRAPSGWSRRRSSAADVNRVSQLAIYSAVPSQEVDP